MGLGADAFEEAAAFAEEGGDQVELDLVEDAGLERGRGGAHPDRLGGIGAEFDN